MLDDTPIQNLNLEQVFSGLGINNSLLTQPLETSNGIVALFDATTHHCIWITDDKDAGYSVFVTETKGMNKDKLLAIQNTQSKSLFLWRIDGVMFSEQVQQQKCDCALLHDKTIHFIELKSNAKNNTIESIKSNYQKAYNQLDTTFKLFKMQYEQSYDSIFSVFEHIYAVVVFSKLIPQSSAMQKSLIKSFGQQNKVRLIFGNQLSV